MKEYLGQKKKSMIGEEVYLENVREADDWRGTLLEIGENHVVIEENGRRKLVPFCQFINMVAVKDVQIGEKDTKPYKL